MKHLYIIGGTMGVGKTTVCRILKERLDRSVFLDGDWCWVMHEQSIMDEILSRLRIMECRVHRISLICTREALEKRLRKDVEAGVRTEDVIVRSLDRIGLYEKLDTVKIDVSSLSPEESAARILESEREAGQGCKEGEDYGA